MPMKAPKSVERGILSLIEDGIGLAISVERLGQVDGTGPLARASVLASFFLLEAVANACLESVGVTGRFAEDLDRLPTLSKFDAFLTLGLKKRQLNRGIKEVQGIRELKSLRDCFVHQRRQSIIWETWNPRGESRSKSPVTPVLGLSKIPSYCNLEDALKVLRATHGFLSYFFKKRCGFSKIRVSSILISDDPHQRPHQAITPVWDNRTLQWLQKNRIPLDYLRIMRGHYPGESVWGSEPLPEKSL